MTTLESYDQALAIYQDIRRINNYVPVIDLSSMIRNTDGYETHIDENGNIYLTFVILKKEAKKQ